MCTQRTPAVPFLSPVSGCFSLNCIPNFAQTRFGQGDRRVPILSIMPCTNPAITVSRFARSFIVNAMFTMGAGSIQPAFLPFAQNGSAVDGVQNTALSQSQDTIGGMTLDGGDGGDPWLRDISNSFARDQTGIQSINHHPSGATG